MIVGQETNDRGYFSERAREERAIAEDCTDQSAALAHRKLATEYEKRAECAPAYA